MSQAARGSYTSNTSNTSYTGNNSRTAKARANAGANAGSGAQGYTPTRHRPGGNVQHDEARQVVNKRKERNRRPTGMARALRRNGVNVETSKRVAASLLEGNGMAWMGEAKGEGASGAAYFVQVTRESAPKLRALASAMRFRVGSRGPAAGSTVVIKVARWDKKGKWEEWVAANVREGAVHRALAVARCKGVPGCRVRLCPAEHVPAFHAAGLVGAETFVTVMGVARGRPLEEVAPLTAQQYLAVERAVCSLWTSAVVHSDLHKLNIFYDDASGRATIIDFGFAVVLPPRLADAMRVRVGAAVRDGVRSLGEVFRPPGRSRYGVRNLQGYVDRVQHTRGYGWYNPDYTALTSLFTRMSPEQRAAVPDARRKLWQARQARQPPRQPQVKRSERPRNS